MRRVSVPVWAIVLAALVLGAGCGATTVLAGYTGPSPSDARKHAVESRADSFNRASALYPDPKLSNYPQRKALREFTQREDLLNHPWFVYILGDNGNTIGYYVAKAAPENSCNFLSSTEDVWTSDKSALKMQSPSYDGVYYGASTCDEWFFFDSTTNALIKIRGVKFYVSDQPLKLQAEAIKVSR
jgi:hypothetical protein